MLPVFRWSTAFRLTRQALTQSETNASEGVGLLQVADGALSQVTSLLNRAVTLATEASNGTLNSSQDTAANQEYQSILSEISNIGSTTTYNQEQVFGTGNDVDIYTGDSSAAGSSVDSLNIAALSSTNVGDTGRGDELQQRPERIHRSVECHGQCATIHATPHITWPARMTINYKNSDGTTSSRNGYSTITPTARDYQVGWWRPSTAQVAAWLLRFTTAGAAGDSAPVNDSSDTGIEISGASAAALKRQTVSVQQHCSPRRDCRLTSTATQYRRGRRSRPTTPAGIATISYTDGAGADLTTNNLLTQGGAEATLTALNTAITDVAAQDGYIGAQINTLNAVSQVL